MRLRVLAVFVLALGVRLLYLHLVSGTGCLAINTDPLSDMDAFHRWALQIAGGDWLGRTDFHPYHPWQAAIAPERVWLGWYGPHVFHQEPLYPYFVALIYVAAPRAPMAVVAVQIVMGALTAVGVLLLGRRLAGERAGLAAGVLAAIYGPFLFYESLLLRDTLLVSLTTAFLLAVEEARRRRSPGWWAAAGSIAGAIYLAKASILLFLPVLVAWILLGSGEARRDRLRASGALLAAFSAAISPAVARNAIVGAPALKITTRGAIEFINGNNPYHGGAGWFDADDGRVMSYAREVLTRTRMELLPTVRMVLATWSGRWKEFARLQARKLGYFLAPYEMPNNASFSYFRLNVPLLRLGLPTFFLISPLAAVGLAFSFSRWREFLPHHLFLLATVAGTIAFYVIARFRTPVLPLALVFAGLALARTWELAAARRWLSFGAACGSIAALLAVNALAAYPDSDQVRPTDYLIAAGAFAGRGDLLRAADEIDRGRAVFPEFVPLHEAAGAARERLGDLPHAAEAYREALALDPASRAAAEGLRRAAPSPGAHP